ncbi:MAG: endolytic transglycosylase MltG [Gammaproteobacteria bacterium]|nr:endolytic transglycosylase MltG [Gammaproteobacteria bacterium]
MVIIILTCGYGYNFILRYPNQAEVIFGRPSIHLDTWQHYLISYRLVNNQDLLLKPLGSPDETVLFSIEIDRPTDSIISDLASAGLIADRSLFRDYLIYSGLDTQLQSGTYQLHRGMSAVEIAERLLDSTPLFVTISILPGWRLEEIAESLATTGVEISPEEFIEAANQRYPSLPIQQEIPPGVSLEGFFPPGTHEVERSISAEQLVIFLLEKLDQSLPPKTLEGIEEQGLTLHQGMTLASIVQREAVDRDEMPMIASVFYNRLEISMKLETDPTVQYALGYNSAQNSWWTTPLTYTHLEVLSPYNTYIYSGLPPTPIANPSLAALQAVAFPAQTPYYYFRAACDGSGTHNFSETYEQHLQYACP